MRKHSEDLAKRYGYAPPSYVETNRIKRENIPESERDDVPQRGTEQRTDDWQAYIGKRDEWEEFYEKKRNESGGVGTQHDHHDDDSYLQYAKWTYAYDDDTGDYTLKAPINIWTDIGIDLAETKSVMDQTDWHIRDTWGMIESERYTWDNWTNSFISSHSSGGYSSATERTHGDKRRYHVKIWECGPYKEKVSMQAHEDNSEWNEWRHDQSIIWSYYWGREQILDIFGQAG